MRSKGDKFRRESSYISTATFNADFANAIEANYASLSPLITNEMSADAFQTTYCRMTREYCGGDVVEQFTRKFNSTMMELYNEAQVYRCTIFPLNDVINLEP